MGTFIVNGPDGKEYSVNTPEGGTQQDAIRYIAQKHYGITTETKQPEPVAEDGILDQASRLLESGGRGTIRGVAALADLPADVSNWVGDRVGDLAVAAGVPEDIVRSDVPRSRFSDSSFVKKFGAPLSDASKIEKGAGTFAEWSAPGAAVSKALRAPVGLDIVSGISAAAGESVAGDTGEIVGGMLPIVLSLGKTLIQNRLPATESPEYGAYKFITENAENPELALKNLKEAVGRGERGTLAELTGDRMLYNVEALVPKGSKAAFNLADERMAREAQIISEVEDVFPAAQAADAQKTARDIVENRAGTIRTVESERLNRAAQEAAEKEAASQARVAQFEDDILRAEQMELTAERGARGAEKAAEEAAVTGSTVEGSKDLTRGLNAAAVEFREKVRKPLWKEFEEVGNVDTAPFVSAAERVRKEGKFAKVYAEQARKKHKDVFEVLDDIAAQKDIHPTEIHALASELRKSVAAVKKTTGTTGSAERYMEKLAIELDNLLTQKVGSKYTKAKEAYDKELNLFKGGSVGEVLRAEDAATAAGKLGIKGDPGYTTGKQIYDWGLTPDGKVAGGIIAEAKELGYTGFEAAKFIESGMDKYVRGLVSKHGADKVLKEYPELLAKAPKQLRDDIERLAQAQKTQTATGKGLEQTRLRAAQQKVAAERKAAREEALVQPKIARELEAAERKVRGRSAKQQKGLDSRITAQYANAPKQTVSSLLKNTDDAPKLKRLYDTMAKRGQGDAFKADVKDSLSATLFPTKGGVKRASPASIDTFLKQRKSLVDSGVLTVDEADDILRKLDKTAGQSIRKEAAVQKLDEMGNEFDNLAASILAAGGMGLFKTNSLVIAGAARRQFRAMFKKIKFDENKMAALEDFLANPEKVLRVAEPNKDPKKYAENLLRLALRKQIADENDE